MNQESDSEVLMDVIVLPLACFRDRQCKRKTAYTIGRIRRTSVRDRNGKTGRSKATEDLQWIARPRLWRGHSHIFLISS
ncbi:MAG TPA: hypothetical protein PK006_07945 [Saprospiraceae bacterium]|nr:hypothetical protein [Saprospiraceae bacterium]